MYDNKSVDESISADSFHHLNNINNANQPDINNNNQLDVINNNNN